MDDTRRLRIERNHLLEALQSVASRLYYTTDPTVATADLSADVQQHLKAFQALKAGLHEQQRNTTTADALAELDAIKLTELDTAALIALIDAHVNDLGIIDHEDDPELAELNDLRRRLAELHGEPRPEPLRIVVDRIGAIDDGGFTYRHFYSIAVKDEQRRATMASVLAAFRPMVYHEGRGPGSVFCHRVTVMPEYDDPDCTRWVGVATVERDV